MKKQRVKAAIRKAVAAGRLNSAVFLSKSMALALIGLVMACGSPRVQYITTIDLVYQNGEKQRVTIKSEAYHFTLHNGCLSHWNGACYIDHLCGIRQFSIINQY